LYHAFWGERGRVLVGAVSMVNVDRTDNRSQNPVGRFPNIAEGEPPVHLLTLDCEEFTANRPPSHDALSSTGEKVFFARSPRNCAPARVHFRA
jgi:hypothetical protein